MERRFYIQKIDINKDIITLVGEEHLHLSKVLRLKVGDSAECFFDNSEIFNCTIKEVTKNYSILKIVSSFQTEANPKINITLFQGLPKQDKLEFISQKITELGVTSLVPFSSSFCVAKQNDNKLDRLQKIVINACKQCGRTKLLEIKEHLTFKNMLEELKKFDIVFFANECEKEKTLKQQLEKLDKQTLKNIALVIGSEGGFSNQEIECLLKLENTKSISLGKRILRTETASVILSGIVLYELGEI